jgi:citrate lyase subunit beta/citryl-CoA lyase
MNRAINKLRRTLLYIPGNNPAMINNSSIYGADVIVFDLEDSVAIAQKEAARLLVSKALANNTLIDRKLSEVMIRTNGMDTPFIVEDLERIVPARPESIRLPKVEDKVTLLQFIELLEKIEKANNLDYEILVSPILETVKGVTNANEIATAHKRLCALSFGAEDFTRDLGTSRTIEGTELSHARGIIVLAAKTAGIQALDTVFAHVSDIENLRKETEKIKQLGFDGKSVIHPNQIEIVHTVFKPSQKDIDEAIAIEGAIKKAEESGSGVIALNGRMVDTPVVKKAQKIIQLAKQLGLL